MVALAVGGDDVVVVQEPVKRTDRETVFKQEAAPFQERLRCRWAISFGLALRIDRRRKGIVLRNDLNIGVCVLAKAAPVGRTQVFLDLLRGTALGES